jgi:flagellar biosynthesis protein FlhA
MATATRPSSPFDRLLKQGDIALAVFVVAIICVMLLPLPTVVLDVLLTLNLGAALMVLMVSLYAEQPLQFSTFPTLLLVLTLARLSLNISTSRLVLSQGYAGHVIEAFGNFVVGGNYIVGFVIFLILTIIQFVVITAGAGRISEVAARFTLDAMPGKQMAIDADLNSGMIDELGARARRQEIQREADFYGAMDGASKFVRGDAVAGIIIIVVNLVGGILIGTLQQGKDISQALMTYALLTIGDGLITQVPALVISVATGILVSRAASELSLGENIGRQIFFNPKAVGIVSAVLLSLAMVPALPKLPFLLVGGIVGAIAWNMRRSSKTDDAGNLLSAGGGTLALAEGGPNAAGKPSAPKEPENMINLLKIDPLELEIGYRLIPLVDTEQGGDLLERITKIRRQMALQLGLVLPPIRVRDNIQLKPRDYSIKLRGIEIAHGEIHVGHFLAMNPGIATERLEGIDTVEPVFGLPATWISEAQKERAEILGYTVFDPSTVIATHLTEMVKRFSSEILTRQDVQSLLDHIKGEAPAVVDELVPGLLSVGEIQRVLQNLLKERISIRDLTPILEALANWSRSTKDPDVLSEYARQALARSICQQYALPNGSMPVITLQPQLETMISESVSRNEMGMMVNLDPSAAQRIITAITKEVEKAAAKGYQPLIICSAKIRLVLRRLTERSIPQLVILAYNEIVPQQVQLQTVGNVTIE